MRGRVRQWLPVVLLGLGVVCVLTWVLMPTVRRGPSREQFEFVTPGMTQEQVVELIGHPPGDHRTDTGRFSVSHHSLLQISGHRHEVWIADDGMLDVYYDADGRVGRPVVRRTKDTRPTWFTRQIDRFAP